jgi:hypothetical protein
LICLCPALATRVASRRSSRAERGPSRRPRAFPCAVGPLSPRGARRGARGVGSLAMGGSKRTKEGGCWGGGGRAGEGCANWGAHSRAHVPPPRLLGETVVPCTPPPPGKMCRPAGAPRGGALSLLSLSLIFITRVAPHCVNTLMILHAAHTLSLSLLFLLLGWHPTVSTR